MLDALEGSDLTEVLPRIAAPTLVLCGRRDRAALPHAGHLLPGTAPRAFNAADDYEPLTVRARAAVISSSASARPSQDEAPSNDLPGSRSL